ncbi:MAG TPA: phosphatase PAP2 family protein [Solirubrobacteraceae bacterium]|nr:phosphatase PAP2 family protein [Solirubrobacteraceae bacterium]
MIRRSSWLPILAAAGCALTAAAVWVAVTASSQVEMLDAAADHGFIGLRRPSLAPIATAVARSVNPVPLVIAAIVLMGIAIVRGRIRVAAAVAVILIGANLTTQVLKPLLAHPRFAEWLGHAQINGASWPSGHSTAAMAIALCAVLVAPARLRPAVAALGAVFAVAIAYSLVAMGWHWPADVLGGFLVAATWTLLAVAALREADLRWAAGTGREKAARLRDALTPPAVAAAGALGVVALLVALKPHAVLGYMAEHPAALTGAVAIAALGTVLATGLALVLKREPGATQSRRSTVPSGHSPSRRSALAARPPERR